MNDVALCLAREIFDRRLIENQYRSVSMADSYITPRSASGTGRGNGSARRNKQGRLPRWLEIGRAGRT